jgi:hypothetical protein
MQGLLNYLPSYSVSIILALTAILTLAGMFLSKKHSNSLISNLSTLTKKVDALLSLSHQISGDARSDVVIKKFLNFSLKLTRSNVAYILFPDEEGLVLEASIGGGFEKIVGKVAPTETTLAGLAFERGEPLMLGATRIIENEAVPNEQSSGENSEESESSAPSTQSVVPLTIAFQGVFKYQARNAIAIPLKTKQGTIAVLELLNNRGGKFDPFDIRLLNFLAGQAASSIELAMHANQPAK